MAVPERVLFRRKYRGLRTVVTLGWMCVVAAIAMGAAWYAGDSGNHYHGSSHGGSSQRSGFGTLEVEGGFSLLGALDGNQCSDHMPRFVALAVWVAGVLYTFLAIAIVCDDFFVASLEAISEALDLSEDVAGATFMAAGSSAPELFSSITGVFFVENVEEDNVGPGTIVGSAVFNIAIIIGASTICAGKALNLDWWPLARDGSFYLLSIALLFVTFVVITPKQVDWFEGLLLVFFYALYIVLMKFNPRIVDYLDAKYGTKREELEDEEMGGQHAMMMNSGDGHHGDDGNNNEGGVTGRRSLQLHYEFPPHVDPEAARRASAGRKPYSFRTVAIAVIAANRFANSPRNNKEDELYRSRGAGESALPVAAVENDGDNDGEEDEEKGPIGKALWVLSLPILYCFKFTIPDCNSERWKKWYMLSFLASVAWIAVVSYFMVEFGIKMGRCLHLSTNVMALTVLAAGTSVPDALSSILVAKMGKGNMAVSNAIGSNVFDILLGLGLPWFLSGAIVRRTPLPINTDGILVYVFMLVLVLFVFLAIVRFSRWSISPKQGWALCALYPTYCVISLAIDKGIIPIKKALH